MLDLSSGAEQSLLFVSSWSPADAEHLYFRLARVASRRFRAGDFPIGVLLVLLCAIVILVTLLDIVAGTLQGSGMSRMSGLASEGGLGFGFALMLRSRQRS